MKQLGKVTETLTVGMLRVRREWISSCLYGFLIIAILMAMTAFYVVLNEWATLLASIAQAM